MTWDRNITYLESFLAFISKFLSSPFFIFSLKPFIFLNKLFFMKIIPLEPHKFGKNLEMKLEKFFNTMKKVFFNITFEGIPLQVPNPFAFEISLKTFFTNLISASRKT